MSVFTQAYEYAASNPDKLLSALKGHLLLVWFSVALVVGLPLGLMSADRGRLLHY